MPRWQTANPRTPWQGRRRLNERLRAEYMAGAEAEWRKRTSRPMTAEELALVLRRYPSRATRLSRRRHDDSEDLTRA
jgi:hypothetical protein